MNDVAVDEEYGGGNWKDGVSALNFKTVNLEDIDPNTGAPYNYQEWETTLENNKTALDEDWSAHMGADTNDGISGKSQYAVSSTGLFLFSTGGRFQYHNSAWTV